MDMHNNSGINTLTDGIIGAAIEVHKELGPGLLETIYEQCLIQELESQGLQCEQQKALPLHYKGQALPTQLRLDLIVENQIILEIKSVQQLQSIHEAQLLTYLRLANKPVGLLLNFNTRLLKQGIKRLVLDYRGHKPMQQQSHSAPPRLRGENRITEQLTPAGRQIEHDSFAIVDSEAGQHHYPDDQWQIVRRMIHASADFEFNGLTQFHAAAVTAGLDAITEGRPIIADVEMICVGLSKPRLNHFGVTTHHFISDQDVITQAKAENSTRAVQAMRKAHRLGLLENGIVAIGNAPTALLELIRLTQDEAVRPALIVGMPVGFVSAAESKAAVSTLNEVPWIITEGRKGGSTLVVSTLHALLALAEAEQRK